MDMNYTQKGLFVHKKFHKSIPFERNNNLNSISEIPASPSLNYSNSSELDESQLILQPTNSIFSIIPDSDHLVSSIKSKNKELKNYCEEKLTELKNTTKEFCAVNNSRIHRKSEIEDSTDIKSENKSDKTLEIIISELAVLKSKLDEANQRLKTNESDINIHNTENELLLSKVRKMLEEKEMHQDFKVICNCTSF